MSTNLKDTVATRSLLFTKIIAAIAQYITAAVVLGGKSLTPQALSALFTAYLQAEADLLAARATVTAKKQARDAALAAANAVLPSLRKNLAATYGELSTTYAAFGLPVPKTPVKSVQVKAEAATKAAATRKAHEAADKATPAPAATPAKS